MSGSAGGEETQATSMADIEEAMGRIRADVHYTPILQSSFLNSISGLQLFFKCELFQKTGSFKVLFVCLFVYLCCKKSRRSQTARGSQCIIKNEVVISIHLCGQFKLTNVQPFFQVTAKKEQ